MTELVKVTSTQLPAEVRDPVDLYVAPTSSQRMAKVVSREEVGAVLRNRPMSRIPRDAEPVDNSAEVARRMLERIFPHMVQYVPNGVDSSDADFDAHIRTVVKKHRNMGMSAQAEEIERMATSFKGVRHALESVSAEGLLRPDTVIPVEYLPDLFMAVPVWYRVTPREEMASVRAADGTNDPKVHHSTKYFCDLIPTVRWADTFQMFNRRVRPLSDYKGDMIPEKIVDRIKVVQQYFDEVVIMTPYHDVAGREWGDTKWARSIDPYVVAFSKGLPFMFVLGRFSDSGVFPLHSELVADTIAFLRANKEKLSGFYEKGYVPYWHRSGVVSKDDPDQTVFHPPWYSLDRNIGVKLQRHVDRLLKQFDQGTLFDWLRATK